MIYVRVTIKDVARQAGVSTSTVSLILNNKPVSISQETRNAVLAAARELNYHPNQLAVSLVTQKSKTLGLIIPDNSNLFFAQLSKHIETAVNAAGDTFCGYFLTGCMEGLPVDERLTLASKAAAIAVTRAGASTSIPTRSEVQSYTF